MGFNCGIVGLPNVGKSTIFNAMTKAGAQASNYPFCTIEPNIGVVPLRDGRLTTLSALVRPERVVATAVEFVDIAGLVKGASRGAGLGNRFLAHIREVDMIAHIVRCFEEPSVVHIEGRIDPVSDIETVNTELMLSDLEGVLKRLQRIEKTAKSGDKEARAELESLLLVKECLERGEPVRVLSDDVKYAVRALNLLTTKSVIYVANTGEDDLEGRGNFPQAVKRFAEKEGAGFVPICGKIEVEVAELEDAEREEFLKGLGLRESGLDRLSRKAHEVLGLITFFTAGEKEVRAWTIKKGARCPEAAGKVHSDFEKGFIKAEVISYEDFITCRSELACREKGLVRIEGKEYIVKDGDIMHFRSGLA
jgi:GTP-binding protein YchF